MADALTRRRWTGRLTFAILGLLVIFSHLIPLETVPPSLGGVSIEPIETVATIAEQSDQPAQVEPDVLRDPARWIAPDLLILITLAWVARRPSFAPALMIGAVFLLSDLLFQRPPGLWTALVLILAEILRARSRPMRTLPFWLEWATVSFGIITITMIYRFTLSMVLVPQASLGLTLVQLGATLLSYPVVVLVSYAVFGVSRPAPGEVDALGHRI